MVAARIPDNEAARLQSLRTLDVLDSAPEPEFDALVQAAAAVCGVPVSLVSLVDGERQWFKANQGLSGVSETPRDLAFCAHAILEDGVFEVPDALADARFAGSALVQGDPNIRFYAGVPLRLSDGFNVGTLCVIDRQPRQLNQHQREVLGLLGIAASHALERRRDARAFVISEQRFRALSEASPLGVFATDASGDFIFTNPRWQAIFGLSPEQSLGQGWTATLHPADRDAVFAEWQRCAQQRVEFNIEFRILPPSAGMRHVNARARAVSDAAGEVTGFVGSVDDITLRKAQEQALQALGIEVARQHEQLRVTLQSIGDAVITTDASGCVTWLNPAAERMTGWPSAEAKGRALTQVFHIVNEETRLPTENPVATCLAQGKVVGLANHTLLISRDGCEFGVEDSAAPMRSEQGEILGVVLVFHDVTEQRRLSGEMSYRATHDALTGLVNRAEFEVRLRRALNKAHEDRSEHALMYIDLDQFKLVNDACGHSVGDQLLQQVSKLLQETIRARDTLARLGGDEFAVILEHCTAARAARVGQQICERMDDFRFMHDGRRFRIGTSIGLVPVDNRWGTTAAILQAADTSCYAAKEAGRNRVHAWFDTDQAMRARHGEMQWASRLEQALDEGRFRLFAQRIQALTTRSDALHAEVLLRMVDSDGSEVLPGAFLPAAERFHLASRIDRWVLRQSITHLAGVEDLSSVATLCINLSGQSIGDRAFHRQAIEVLTLAGPDICQRLCLEITETSAITNMADASLFIEEVHKLGIRVALDDFGAGASSFGYLKSLKVDLIKIDGQFIRDLLDDPLDDAAVRCFVDVARVIGVKTVAEFVDRPAVLERVRELGIDFAQGFLLHRPHLLSEVLPSTSDFVVSTTVPL